ncbi:MULTISPECIES: SgcJ/EcaC family oxidoreductase [unclassified Streptomyces]|uniref:SgcJ/EcaC family oxidoreductase n=1 Tax=unclassified Streptomyces TaxID=2593676 RepID=UPI00364B8865
MQRHIRTRAAVVTVALVAAGAVTVGVSQAAPEHGSKSAADRAAAKPTKKQIAALFDGWNKALQTGDSKKVAARYASDAVLLPTASPQIRTNHAEIVDYFDHFLLNKPKGEKIRSVINVLDSNSAIDAGLYVFQLTDPKTGEQRDVEARYTYEYEKRGGKWLIVNHHSSVLPAAS